MVKVRGMVYSLACLSLALAATLFGNVFAGERATRAHTLALDAAIALALTNNPDLRAARYALDIAQARRQQAGLLSNPRLEFSGSNDFAFNNEGEYSVGIGISQTFPITDRLTRERQVADVDIQRAGAEISSAGRLAALDVATTYYQILDYDRQLAAQKQLLESAQTLTQATRNRYNRAEVSELDVNTAALEVQRLNQASAQSRGQRAAAVVALNRLLGNPASEPLDLVGPTPPVPALPDLRVMQEHAATQRPELRLAQLNIDRTVADTALAKAQRWED